MAPAAATAAGAAAAAAARLAAPLPPPRADGWRAPAEAVVAVLRRCGVLPTVAVLVPASSMATVLATVAVCWRIWRAGASHVPGVMFPAISELGVEMPQKKVYQLGFGIGGALLACGIALFELVAAHGVLRVASMAPPETLQQMRGPKPLLQQEQQPLDQAGLGTEAHKLMNSLLFWGYAAAGGVVLQGVFVLERSIGWRCFVHWGGAVLFMAGAMQHARASNELYALAQVSADALSRARQEMPTVVPGSARGDVAAAEALGRRLLKDGGVRNALKVRRLIVDYSSIVLFAVPLLAQMLLPRAAPPAADAAAVEAGATADGAAPTEDATAMNTMGLAQWGIILQFACYFCTYTADLRAASLA